MARMPTENQLDHVEMNSRGVVQAPRDQIGAAVKRAGSTIAEEADATLRARLSLNRKRKNEDDALDLARATAEWNTRVTNERSGYTYDQDQNYSTWGKRFGENAVKHREAAAGMIRDRHTQKLFLARTQDDLARHQLEVNESARTIDLNKRQVDALEAIDANLAAATRPGSSAATATRAIQDARASIDNMANAGLLTPEVAAKKRIEFARRYASIKVARDIEEDPAAVSKRLNGEGGEGYYRKLGRKESGGSDLAQASTSSAAGRYQFTKGTWRSLMARHPELGLTEGGMTNRAQAERAIRVFTQENMEVLKGAGIPVNEKTLYLAHFLGAEGAKKAWFAHPDAPADRVLPEAAAANRTVFYNKDGSPKTMAEVIANQTRSFSGEGGPAPGYYEFLDPDERVRLASASDAEWARRDKAADEKSALDRYVMRNTLEDDVAQIENTGVAANIDTQTVVDTLGEDGAAKWLEDRKVAADTFAAISPMEDMSAEEIEAHLEGLEAKVGDENFANKEKVHDKAERRADKLLRLRLEDPAGSVEDNAIVRNAKRNYDPNDPASVQNLTRARLAAQEAVGINPAMQQPITRSEARTLIAPIQSTIDLMDASIVAALAEGKGDITARRLAMKTVRAEAEKTIVDTINRIEDLYGPNSGKVLAFAIAESVRDKQIGDLTSSVLRKIANGDKPSITEAQSLDAAMDSSQAGKAIEGTLPKPAPKTSVPQNSQKTPTPTRGTPVKTGPDGKLGASWPYPSQPAIEALTAGKIRPQVWDKTYGPGSAESWGVKG